MSGMIYRAKVAIFFHIFFGGLYYLGGFGVTLLIFSLILRYKIETK